MDDNAPKENPPADFNKLDLSQLQGFSFGTQWTQEKPSAPGREGGERPRREDRREGGGAGAPGRDRRTFRRPAGAGPGDSGAGAPQSREGAGPGGPERRDFAGGGGGPRREGPGGGAGGGGGYRGGPRREGGYAGGGERGGRFSQGGGQGGQGGYGRGMQDRGPYESPYYAVTFYPEDTSFNTLVQTIRKSCRTVELFEIARTVVAKNDRFVVVLAHKPQHEPAPRPTPAGAEPAAPAAKAPRPMFHVSVPDGLPFESDEAAVSHVLSKHLDRFFDTAEVEVDPPKGNFQVINKCGITGELLGPPNYHRYNQIVQQHYAAKIGSRMSLEAYRSRIETVRDPEVVNQWLAKMKKTTRYTWKLNGAKPAAAAAAAPAASTASASTPEPTAAPEASSSAPASEGAEAGAPKAEDNVTTETAPAAEKPAAPDVPTAPAAATVPTFDTLEDARMYLLTTARDKVVRSSENARFHGKSLDTMPDGEIRHAVEGALERQRRFPLDTANALRGRLRREHFTIFKKGSKGVSYVCAVKRKFRIPGQTFSDSIGALISFIETNPMVRASELAGKFLGISLVPSAPAAAATPAASAPAGAETPASDAAASVAPAAPKADASLTIDERAKISRMQGDLMWLVREGYVTEFIDGRLFAPPPMVEARKKEIENEEHDPENFPETPAGAEASSPPPATGSAPEETAPPASPEAQSPATEAPPHAPDASPVAPGASDERAPEASIEQRPGLGLGGASEQA